MHLALVLRKTSLLLEPCLLPLVITSEQIRVEAAAENTEYNKAKVGTVSDEVPRPAGDAIDVGGRNTTERTETKRDS